MSGARIHILPLPDQLLGAGWGLSVPGSPLPSFPWNWRGDFSVSCDFFTLCGKLCPGLAFGIPRAWAIGEGNGNPLQCSCLENPRDGEAWLAAVYEVAQSRTRLKRLSSSSSSSAWGQTGRDSRGWKAAFCSSGSAAIGPFFYKLLDL